MKTLSLSNHRRDLWPLDPLVLYLNHGSYGATPRAILEAQRRYQLQMESAPTIFMRNHLPELIQHSRCALASFLNAPASSLAFATSATEATNVILRSLLFRPGDEVVVTNHGYGAVWQSLCFLHDTIGIRPVVANVPYPLFAHEDVVEAVQRAVTPQTKLVIVDHITSPTALIFPVSELVSFCRTKKIPILVDGAHIPGHLPLDLGKLQPDFYVGNFHKWLCAPKGSAFLYAAESWLSLLHPLSISHFYKKGFLEEFDWSGTADRSAWLCLPDCIAWFQEMGGFEGLVARNRTLVRAAGSLLEKECDLQWGHPATDAFMGCMAALRVPKFRPHDRVHKQFIERFFQATGTDIQAAVFNNELLVRVSAQAYNCLDDYKRFAKQFNQFDFSTLPGS